MAKTPAKALTDNTIAHVDIMLRLPAVVPRGFTDAAAYYEAMAMHLNAAMTTWAALGGSHFRALPLSVKVYREELLAYTDP